MPTWSRFASFPLVSLLFTFVASGTSVVDAFAAAGTGTIEVVASGGTAEGIDWSFNSGTITTVDGDPAQINAADLVAYLNSGDLLVDAARITVSDDVLASANNFSLTLKATGDIVVNSGVSVATRGGDLIFWADSDLSGNSSTSGGSIAVLSGATIGSGTGAGDLVFAGGSDGGDGIPDDYAFGGYTTGLSAPGTAAIFFHSATVEAGTGKVFIKGHGTGAATNFQIGVWMYDTSITAGEVEVLGRGSLLGASSSNRGVYLAGTTIQSPGDISISGWGGQTAIANPDSNQIGIHILTGTSGSSLSTSGSGSISLTGFGGGGPNNNRGDGKPINATGILVEPNQTISSGAGEIRVEGTSGYNGGNYGGVPSPAIWIQSSPSSSSGNINLIGNASVTGTTGVGGALWLSGISGASGTVSLTTPYVATQSAGISADKLALYGSGTYTLTNTSNDVGTVAGGSGGSKLGSVNLVDASGGLTIGQVGALQGITSTGTVTVETLAGDLVLSRSVATDSTSSTAPATAITLNAGKSTAAGTGTGGDVVVSGSPSLIVGTGGLARVFSGSEAASTGLTTLVGGSSRVQYGVDETSTLNPALVSGAYALYRSTVQSPPSSGSTPSGGSSRGTSSSREVAPTNPDVAPTRAPVTRPPVRIDTPVISKPVERPADRFDENAPARVTQGGIQIPLSVRPAGSSSLLFAAGGFEFGLTVDDKAGGEVAVDTPSRSPEVIVPTNASGEISGRGSFPGSFVQVWLGSDDENARELARIPVRADGSFDSNLQFAADRGEAPVPIGRQVVQVFGYDSAGRPTAVDMTVNIAQGVPAPEPIRATGELPDLTPGSAVATSAGDQERVSVTAVPEAKNVVVEGSGWTIGVNVLDEDGVVRSDSSDALIRLSPSGQGAASGTGFMAGSTATVWFFSEPTLVATVTVNDDGTFSAPFLVDGQFITPGEHTLQIQGVGTDGYIKAANLGVLVEEPVAESTSTTQGLQLMWWVFAAVVILVTLLVVAVSRRRRKTA